MKVIAGGFFFYTCGSRGDSHNCVMRASYGLVILLQLKSMKYLYNNYATIYMPIYYYIQEVQEDSREVSKSSR